MEQKINIEAEKNELILRNKEGDYTIIPAKHRAKVQKMLDDGCHSCIDELVDTLPVMADYANDGAVFPEDEEVEVYTGDQKYDVKTVAKRTGTTQLPYEKEPSTHRMSYAEVNGEYVAYPTLFQDKNNKWVDLDVAHNNVDKWAALREARKRGETFSFKDEKSAAEFAKGSWKNNYKKMNTSSEEYRTLYNEGKIAAYDKETDAYIATPSKEVTITGGAPQWSKYKREYEKTNPKSDYINRYLTSFAKAIGNTKTNYPKRLDDEYEQNSLDYVSEQLVKNKPQGKLSRAEWLSQMSDKEEEIIKRNPKYQSSLWADTKRGLTSLVEQNPLQAFQNILNSSDYTNREKQEMLKDYADHPVMSKLGDVTKILNPLTVPSKMVQSAYKDNYSFTDALKGKKNNAGIVEDIVTDPLNLVGLGIWSKLSKANKFTKLEDAYQAVKGLSKEESLSKLNTLTTPEGFQNKVFKTNIQLGEYNGVGHLSEKGYNYRTLSQKEIDAIKETKGVFPKEGKAKGGNENVKYWTEGNEKNWYGDKTNSETIRVRQDKFSNDKVIDANNVEFYNKQTGKFEPILSKEEAIKNLSNLPKLKQTPLEFNIEDIMKNISSTERKNMTIIKEGDKYFKNLNNPESLKRLKEFGDEYGIDLLDAYKKAEQRWDYGKNIGKHENFQIAGKDVFKDDIESALGLSTLKPEYFRKKMLKPKTKTLIPESKGEIDKYSINYVNEKASVVDYPTIVWHELSHDINKNIIGQSTKLQKDISEIFTKDLEKISPDEITKAFNSQKFDTYEKGLVKSKKAEKTTGQIAKEELEYVTRPTETWAFLSTNLRQDLKNTGVIKDYNELLTPEKLNQAIKNGNTVFSRFEPYIKDKNKFIELFNKMTLSIAPAALYLQSQNKSEQ